MNELYSKVKIVVTVPPEFLDGLRLAMGEAGAGIIGNYTLCSTVVESIGTFMPNSDANPYIGKPRKLEFIKEARLEMICPREKIKQVLSAIHRVHPYEHPAIDLIPLLDENSL